VRKPIPIAKSKFKRNDVPTPDRLPVDFDIKLSVDRTKITEQEYYAILGKAYVDASEAWMLKHANDNPDGYFAKTYFTKIEG